jgi:hypothetical protein
VLFVLTIGLHFLMRRYQHRIGELSPENSNHQTICSRKEMESL